MLKVIHGNLRNNRRKSRWKHNGMPVALTYNLNLSLQLVTINIRVSVLCVFTLTHASMRLYFFTDFFFSRIFLKHLLQDHSRRKKITKHNIQKTHIHIFQNRLLREVALILELLSQLSNNFVRIVLEPTL